MKLFLMLSLVAFTMARPEPPRGQFPVPQAPLSRQQLPRQNYGPPPPSDNYGPAQQPPISSYGPPGSSYEPVSRTPTITKNVYVHLPPNDAEDVQTPQVLAPQPPQKHYKLIFIKAPEPPKPIAPIIPAQPQDEHKTLVYVLVKKPEPQPQIVLPSPEPTQPSKPEVYFIKYKKEDKPVYGPPKAATTPNEEYGAPSTF